MHLISRLSVMVLVASSLAAQEAATIQIQGSSDVQAIRLDDSLYNPVSLPVTFRTRAGDHEVHVYGRERAIYEPSDYSERFHLSSGELKIIEVRLEPMGTVNSIPGGASVWVGDSLAGDTPLWMPLRSLKDRSIVLKKSGYNEIRVAIGDTVLARNHLWVSLRPENGYVEPDNEFLSASWKDRGVGRHRGWLITASVTGLVAGGIAAYYKIKADDLFEKAKVARRQNNLARESSLRKRTKRYDRYSTVGFIGLQLSFTGVVYLFLKSE